MTVLRPFFSAKLSPLLKSRSETKAQVLPLTLGSQNRVTRFSSGNSVTLRPDISNVVSPAVGRCRVELRLELSRVAGVHERENQKTFSRQK